MRAVDILGELGRRGCEVRVAGDRLIVRPPEALDDDLRAAIRQCKTDLLRLLAGEPAPPSSPAPAAGCPFCWDWREQQRQLREAMDALRPHLPRTLQRLPDDRLLALVELAIAVAWRRSVEAAARRTGGDRA